MDQPLQQEELPLGFEQQQEGMEQPQTDPNQQYPEQIIQETVVDPQQKPMEQQVDPTQDQIQDNTEPPLTENPEYSEEQELPQ